MIGRSIGHYKVTERVGAGGMGEVYRARDARLERDVALKVLPEAFAGDAERLMRFEREARLLASLKHAHIATIHGIEQDGATRVLVMELVEGEDLARRLARGPLPVDEAVTLARQIADALEAAHEQGVIHRDLKPANVVVTPDGEAKVLDFGLAKAAEGDTSNSGLSQSPTVLGNSPTVAGVILGTAAYMSPEQARGKRVDRRADIFAFGCLLYEMLTGAQAFGGETVSDTLAAVLRAEPEWDRLPAATPRAIRTLLQRCLMKDPRQRLRDIGEARIVLDAVLRGETGDAPAPAAAPARRPRPLVLWVLAGLVAVCAAGWLLALRHAPAVDAPLVHATINVAPEAPLSLYGAHPGPPAISPDGRHVAFAVITPAGVQLAVRELARDAVRIFVGTDDAGYPFWSPDSRQIGFFSQGRLRRVDLTGGVPVALCDAEVGKGGSWREDGTILFAPSYTTPLFRVGAEGGTPVAVTTLDSTENESSHRFPHFLPDSDNFVYVVRHFSANDRGGHVLRVGSLDGSVSKDLFATESDAIYVDGYLFFVREGALTAQPFDPDDFSMDGTPLKLAEGVQILAGAARGVFDVSPAGVLVYAQGGAESPGHLLLLDGSGREIREIGEAGSYDVGIQLAPDARSVLVGVFNDIGGTSDLWTVDLQRGARTRLTFDPGHDNNAYWSPDGARIAFTARRTAATFGPYVKPVDGSGTEVRVLETGTDLFNVGWSRDGRYLLCHELGSGNQGRLRAVPLLEGIPDPLADHTLPQSLGGGAGLYRIAFSPDGRWMAYESAEGGRGNVYAIPFGRPGQRWQVTLAGGANPRWEGRHLYFERERRLWKIAVETRENALVVGDESRVYSDRWVDDFDVSADERSIIVLYDDNLAAGTSLSLVLNWRHLLPGQP